MFKQKIEKVFEHKIFKRENFKNVFDYDTYTTAFVLVILSQKN